MGPPPGAVRAYRPEDEAAVVGVWHRAGKAVYDFLPAWRDLDLRGALEVFRGVIAPGRDLWVVERDARVVAYIAMRGGTVDRLYVDPTEQRRGLGALLLDHAKALCPDGLQLHTHQENRGARAFYVKHGFTVVRFGISPPPESAPDVEYHWRPGD